MLGSMPSGLAPLGIDDDECSEKKPSSSSGLKFQKMLVMVFNGIKYNNIAGRAKKLRE